MSGGVVGSVGVSVGSCGVSVLPVSSLDSVLGGDSCEDEDSLEDVVDDGSEEVEPSGSGIADGWDDVVVEEVEDEDELEELAVEELEELELLLEYKTLSGLVFFL